MRDADRRRLDSLILWQRQHGGTLHPSVEVHHDATTKFSLRVGASVPAPEAGFTAVTCPASTTLSYLNAIAGGPIGLSSVAKPAFPSRFLQDNPPHVTGRFFLMQQFLRGDDSYWAPYIAALPQPDRVSSWALPAFWPQDEVELLSGTNAQAAIEEMRVNIKREFKQARRMMKEEKFPDYQDYTSLLYNWAFCIFTSRSFRPALVLSAALQRKVSELSPGCKLDDFSILQPLFDIANHSPTARITWDVSDPQTCQLICRDAYLPGAQIFNNYGQKTNGELLLGYGFIIPVSEELHNDYVHVRKRKGQVTEAQPKDFLISLRPMSHPSSLAGRARQLLDESQTRVSAFDHIEDGLVWDLGMALAQDEERVSLENLASSTGEGQAAILLASPTPPSLSDLVTRLKEALGAKLQHDLQRLQNEPVKEIAGQGEVHWTANQLLAMDYSKRCERVLLEALRALGCQSPRRVVTDN